MAAKKKETEENQIEETQTSPSEDINPDDLNVGNRLWAIGNGEKYL